MLYLSSCKIYMDLIWNPNPNFLTDLFVKGWSQRILRKNAAIDLFCICSGESIFYFCLLILAVFLCSV